MEKIRAAVCREHNAPLTIEEVLLAPPGEGQIEVEIAAVAICHSDISFLQGGFGGTLPTVAGHEAAGIITKLGEGVKGLSVGDHVCVTLIHACGHCRSCASASPTTCETPVPQPGPLSLPDGTPIYQAMACGAFAEKVVVDQSQVVVIPSDMSMEAASLVSCGVITGLGAAVNAANVRPGQDVVVIGAGGVGLNAIQGARLAGARRVVAVDMTEEKLAIAREFGATDGVLAEGKPWAAVKALLGKGADSVLVTVGAAPAYDTAPRYLVPTGRVIAVGMPHLDKSSTYSPMLMARQAQGIEGSMMGNVIIRRDIPWIVDLYQQGRIKLDELISGRWRLEEINEAIADTVTGTARRNVLLLR
ncbi:zinc-binding dehydrogenase [Maritimibacter alkaliphilus]|uniref:zinc-binding dehydrogenase n=1 Tax=Maritimibacter alkaliphilus TaxID=404236 RepID=UPI001C9688C2|nr:zinc-binding dehydrogenase [Maritimibacter alkaliphilus]MBY6091020.1 alcohol dehydrogenase catalytic domain-containing protein [Maritimibacter alkaliphilus]